MERLDNGLRRGRSTRASCCHNAATGADALSTKDRKEEAALSVVLMSILVESRSWLSLVEGAW